MCHKSSLAKTMSISSPKFNLYWKHGNTRTQFYKSDLLVWSYCHQWVYSREHGMRNGIQVHYISKTECPKLPVTHTLLKKKKGKKTMRYFPSQMLLNKWMVSVPRFLSHSEITESPTWSIKKKKSTLTIFLYMRTRIYLILLFPAEVHISQKVQTLTYVLNSQ